jgi:hypothetical protein
MAVLVEAISVIVKVSSLEEHYPGGWAGFRDASPNQTLCCDNEIARVGFMVPDDVRSFVDGLERCGLTYVDNDQAVDICVVDQQRGPMKRSEWLEFGKIELKGGLISACKLAGSGSNQVFTPDGWTFEGSLSQSFGFSPTESNNAGMRFLRHENGLDVYFNELSGKEVYVGRASDKPSA